MGVLTRGGLVRYLVLFVIDLNHLDFAEHYHAERNHQGLGNVIPFPSRDSASPVGRIGRRERLGGVLSLYERKAA